MWLSSYNCLPQPRYCRQSPWFFHIFMMGPGCFMTSVCWQGHTWHKVFCLHCYQPYYSFKLYLDLYLNRNLEINGNIICLKDTTLQLHWLKSFPPKKDWERVLSWCLGSRREGVAGSKSRISRDSVKFPVPQTLPWLESSTGFIFREADIVESWWRGRREKGGLLLNPIKPFPQRLAGARYCKRLGFCLPPLLPTNQDENQTKQSITLLYHSRGPISTFSIFTMWADWKKLNPFAAPLGLRETWSSIWLYMLVCEM